MSLNDLPTIPNPQGLELVYNSIQESMHGLSWIDKSYGNSIRMKEDRNGKILTFPKVYNAKREYIKLGFDDTLSSYSFIETEDNETITNFSPKQQNYTRISRLNVIVWANLERIGNTNDYLFIEKLKEDVMVQLSNNKYISSINGFSNNIDETWKKYTLPSENRHYSENYATFAVKLVVSLNDRCHTLNDFQNINC